MLDLPSQVLFFVTGRINEERLTLLGSGTFIPFYLISIESFLQKKLVPIWQKSFFFSPEPKPLNMIF